MQKPEEARFVIPDLFPEHLCFSKEIRFRLCHPPPC